MDMRRRIVQVAALAAGLWAIAGVTPAEARQPVPFEQRQQMRQEMREHWQQMPPDRRDMRREEYRERWQQQMPSGERQRLREEMREQRGGYGGRGGRW